VTVMTKSVVANRFRALRSALGLTQEEVAKRSGRLDRNYVNRIENGHNKGASDHVRGAMSAAYHITRDDLAEYLEGRLELEKLLERREHAAAVSHEQPLFRNHPRWADLVREAQSLRRSPIEDFERIADSPFLWGPLDRLDAMLLADLVRDVREWAERASAVPSGSRR
jgi:transcriptional regulator with XRE-family HTH domain